MERHMKCILEKYEIHNNNYYVKVFIGNMDYRKVRREKNLSYLRKEKQQKNWRMWKKGKQWICGSALFLTV
ncbi:hypothetical protein FZ054_15990, partial [Listeria monocytogenes]